MTTSGNESEYSYETQLLVRVAQGDESAFTEFYHRLSPLLYGMALKIMHDAKDAEDVLQESFCTMWRKAGTFNPSAGTALTWAVLIVRHKAIDKLRIRERRERVRERVESQREQFPVGDQSSAEQASTHERARQVRTALAEVSDEQKQALELAFFSDMTHEEIAAELQTPLGTIKARIRRGLLRLHDLLEGRLG